jgi:hypothetical protein
MARCREFGKMLSMNAQTCQNMDSMGSKFYYKKLKFASKSQIGELIDSGELNLRLTE